MKNSLKVTDYIYFYLYMVLLLHDSHYLKVKYLIQNSILIIGIILISFIVPLLNLKALKPTNIIKAKE